MKGGKKMRVNDDDKRMSDENQKVFNGLLSQNRKKNESIIKYRLSKMEYKRQ